MNRCIFLFFCLCLTPLHAHVPLPSETSLREKEWSTCLSFLQEKGKMLFAQGQTYIKHSHELPFSLEKDPETDAIYLHLDRKRKAEIGRGGQKVVSKSILLGKKPILVARCEPRYGRMSQDEIRILRRLKGVRGIIQLKSCLKRPNEAHALILEYFNRGTLKDFVEKNGAVLTNSQLISIIKDLLIGLQNLHSMGIFHRDIHSKNILLHQTNTIFRAAWTDFGLSHERSNPSELFSVYSPSCPPEALLTGSRLTIDPQKAETYALGLCLYYLAFAKHPSWSRIITYSQLPTYSAYDRHTKFHTIMKLYNNAATARPEKGVRKQIIQIIMRLVHPNPDKRMSPEEAVRLLRNL